MAYANISELKANLDDSVAYCQAHPEKEICQVHGPRLAAAQETLLSHLESSNLSLGKWKREAGEDKLAWKHLAKLLREVQGRLDRIDAIGYPDERVQYWYPPRLVSIVDAMSGYLRERADEIDFAEDYLARLETQLDAAYGEDEQSVDSLRSYHRDSQLRAAAMSRTAQVVGDFRDSMRRHLGVDHPDYKAIRWAFSISPDRSVL